MALNEETYPNFGGHLEWSDFPSLNLWPISTSLLNPYLYMYPISRNSTQYRFIVSDRDIRFSNALQKIVPIHLTVLKQWSKELASRMSRRRFSSGSALLPYGTPSDTHLCHFNFLLTKPGEIIMTSWIVLDSCPVLSWISWCVKSMPCHLMSLSVILAEHRVPFKPIIYA